MITAAGDAHDAEWPGPDITEAFEVVDPELHIPLGRRVVGDRVLRDEARGVIVGSEHHESPLRETQRLSLEPVVPPAAPMDEDHARVWSPGSRPREDRGDLDIVALVLDRLDAERSRRLAGRGPREEQQHERSEERR